MEKFRINRGELDSQDEFIERGHRCNMRSPTDRERQRTRTEISSMRASGRGIENVTINVQFIHITSGNTGRISESQREKQIEVLNQAYSNSGIQFYYNPETVITVDKPAWFNMGKDSFAERQAKTQLHVPPQYSLNFYTAGLQPLDLGWATFPLELEGDPDMDGVVILYSSLPEGDAVPYNLGQTATHEIGHWLGLYHTFEGGCNGMGDEVDDTEAHARSNFGCGSTIKYADKFCSGETQCPLKNYMNYVDDACMTEFTNGQISRMKDMLTTYRSGLVVGPLSSPPLVT
jgi:hypothetical protein